MNSIIDLNTVNNVNYNLQSDYTIAFGNSLGNASVTTDVYSSSTAQRQVPVTTLANCVRDVLVDFSFSSPVPVANVVYTGPYANIGILPVSSFAWRAFGIRSVAQYDELFANTEVRDANISNAYTYTTLVNDQFGNTRTWSTAVSVRAAPQVNIVGNVIYDEDVVANIATRANVTANVSTVGTYVLTANITPSLGLVSNGVTSATSVAITGNVTSINNQIGSGALTFDPISDLASNVANAINLSLTRNGFQVSQGNLNIQIANTHNEYSLTTAVNYSEDAAANLTFAITDLDPDADSFEVVWQQTTPAQAGLFLANGVSQGWGNSATLTGSKTHINATAVSYRPPVDFTGNIVLTYTQVKYIDGKDTIQAAAVPVNLTCTSTHNEYSLLGTTNNANASLSFVSLVNNSLNYTITDTDTDAGVTYDVAFAATGLGAGNTQGYWNVNGANVGTAGANLSLLGQTKSQINTANISWWPDTDITGGSASFAFTQRKNAADGNVYLQANVGNVWIARNTPYSLGTGGSNYSENSEFAAFDQIAITDPATDSPTYVSTFTQLTPALTSNANIGAFQTTTGDRTWTGQFQLNPSSNAQIDNLEYYPPVNYEGNIVIGYTQVKTIGNVSVTQVENAQYTLTNNYTYPGFVAPANGASLLCADQSLGGSFSGPVTGLDASRFFVDNDDGSNVYLYRMRVSVDQGDLAGKNSTGANEYFGNTVYFRQAISGEYRWSNVSTGSGATSAVTLNASIDNEPAFRTLGPTENRLIWRPAGSIGALPMYANVTIEIRMNDPWRIINNTTSSWANSLPVITITRQVYLERAPLP